MVDSTRHKHALEYIAARDSNLSPNNATCAAVLIQGKPYYPNLAVTDPRDDDQIRRVVATLLGIVMPPSDPWLVTPITGGITNLLFRIDISESQSILMRLFGAFGLIDRDEETARFALLSESHMAPEYFGRFQNGRLEGWKNDMRALTVRELSDPVIAAGIAKQMARLHSECFLEELADAPSPTLLTQLHDWLQHALQATFQNDFDKDRAQSLSLPQYTQELAWLKQLIQALSTPPSIAFCHNDLLAANILYNPHTKHIQLIDFEYGGFNYAAFDLANHWNEYAGGTEPGTLPNYEWLPTPHAQREFVSTYLKQVTASFHRQQEQTNESSSNSRMDVEIDVWLQHVRLFQLINHVYWGLWAVNQAAAEGCQEFDYLQYATKRLERYQSTKGTWDEEYKTSCVNGRSSRCVT